MHIAILSTCHLEYVAQLANALSLRNQVTIHLADGLIYIVRDNRRHPDETLFRQKYESYLDPQVTLGSINPNPYKWDLASLAGVHQVARAIRETKPDILHIQEAIDFRLFLIAKAMSDIPLVVTSHDPRVRFGDKVRLDTRVELILRRLVRQRASHIIVHSGELKHAFLDNTHVNPNRISVIPHGAYDLYRRWALPNITERDQSVLFFGRLVPSKGLDCLIDAEPFITACCPGARIVIVGEGNEWRANASRVVHPDRFIVENSFIGNEHVTELFQQACLVVLPYRDGSQSGVAALACALGKPVVATRVGGLPELVEDGVTGIIVPPDDPKALSEAVVYLLKSPETRRQMSRNALSKANGELSWDLVAAKTEQVYRETIAMYGTNQKR